MQFFSYIYVDDVWIPSGNSRKGKGLQSRLHAVRRLKKHGLGRHGDVQQCHRHVCSEACYVLYCLSCFQYSYLCLTCVVSLSFVYLALPCPAVARPDDVEMLTQTSKTPKRRQETPKEPD